MGDHTHPEGIVFEVFRDTNNERITCFPTLTEAEEYAARFNSYGWDDVKFHVREYKYTPYSERPTEVPKEHVEAVRYRSWVDHRSDKDFGVTKVPTWVDVEVIEVKVFPKVYLGSPDDYATVEVRYSVEGARAIYGVMLDGTPRIYAD